MKTPNPKATASDMEQIEGVLLDALSVCQDYRRTGPIADLMTRLEEAADDLRDAIDEANVSEGNA